jgi:hypothetical protein
MAVLISVGGNAAGDGFLLAPVGSTYEVEISLATDAGILAATLQASPDAAGLIFSTTNVNLSTAPTIVTVHATLQSATRGDTTIQVLDGPTVVASFDVTAIKHPTVNFRGRFEARFGTDGGFYNRNPQYTAAIDSVVPPGWTWSLEGEPNFVPPVGNVPENLETPVGRVIRLNNPAALRSHAEPVVSIVESITGDTTLGPETFLSGDPIIGEPVNVGPDTYFAGNDPRNPADPTPEEYFGAAQEPLALFELHFGGMFSGASRVGPFVAKSMMSNQITRTPDSRPIANGLVSAAPERAEIGLPSQVAWSETRIDLLVADYNALPAGASPERRNLVRRIGHLLNAVSAAKRMAVQAANPGAFTTRTATIPQSWEKEVYDGKVDTALAFAPGASAVVAYLSEFTSFNVHWTPFAFHSDELCGYHKGHLTHLNADGSYSGDPHTRTVNNVRYDFQAVGEFTLLRDASRLEVQVRQSPVATQHPITDAHSGLTACVSVITAAALRLGKRRVSLQPAREGKLLQLYVDGKAASVPAQGLDLGDYRVTTFDANGEMGVRVDGDDQTVVTLTPAFWNAHNIWYMNVSVSNTRADEGIMGIVPKDSWLPRLRKGLSLGPKPASLHDRYVSLYKTFADSWRVTAADSLFVYAAGTTTKTFTDPDWPAEKPPCTLKPAFQVPGVQVFKGMPVETARGICNAVTMKDLHENCVFDVATTGDPIFAEGYLLAQELRLYGTAVKLTVSEAPARQDRMPDDSGDQPPARAGGAVRLTATVVPAMVDRPVPTGEVTFFVDGMSMKRPSKLEGRGRARLTLPRLKPGEHTIRAAYAGGGTYDYHASSSPEIRHTVGRPKHEDKPQGARSE